MKKIIYDNYLELSVKTAEQIAAIMIEKPDALICLPSGETPVGTFKHLIELNKSGKISFKHTKIVGLDEWVKLVEMKKENCLHFMKKHFFDYIDYSEENLRFFDGESSDLIGECKKTDEFIKKYGPIDLVLLGVGMNGHLGMNEPGTPYGLYSHIVNLAEETKRVGQKYFSSNVKLSSGITLGMKHIVEAKTVIIQMNGSKKAEIAKRLVDSEISMELPASMLKNHSNSFLLLDKESAKYIDSK
jgi:glucosamine-6-phosphate isomerase